jgi:membrane-anchored mycosin MYCP
MFIPPGAAHRVVGVDIPARPRLRIPLAHAVVAVVAVLMAAPPAGTAPAAAGPAVTLQGSGNGPFDPTQCSTPSTTMLPGVPWTQQRLAPERVWPLTTGTGVTVAVIDTGVDATVPQLSGRVLPGVDIVNNAGLANTDCYGHGTFVAGIIGAAPRKGTGVAGVAPGVTILPIRQANGPTDGTSSGLAKAIRYAVDAGARVVNISASAFAPSDELRAAVAYANAHDVLLVAAASNEAQRGNPTAYPAAFPGVVGVGAIGPDGRRTQFSEVGASVDLVAPGQDIVSLSRGGSGHFIDSGTSYAAPFVTATAALVRAYYPRLTAAQIKRRLELTADPPPGPLPDPGVGWGVVNPYRAVTEILPAEYGAGPVRTPLRPITPVTPVPADRRGIDTAVGFAVAVGLAAVCAALLVKVGRHGTERGWRSAGQPIGGQE